jgi:hypothetical protein
MSNCVVFLDIDGVLNTPEDYARWALAAGAREESLFNPQLVARLNRITDATKADIVVSSSWRLYYSVRGRHSFAELRGLLRRVGVTAKVLGSTPARVLERWTAISEWVATYQGSYQGSFPLCFVVLDDDVPADDWVYKHRHVHCLSLPGGLTEKNEARAIELLTGGA